MRLSASIFPLNPKVKGDSASASMFSLTCFPLRSLTWLLRYFLPTLSRWLYFYWAYCNTIGFNTLLHQFFFCISSLIQIFPPNEIKPSDCIAWKKNSKKFFLYIWFLLMAEINFFKRWSKSGPENGLPVMSMSCLFAGKVSTLLIFRFVWNDNWVVWLWLSMFAFNLG